jgi:hypothetical protein
METLLSTVDQVVNVLNEFLPFSSGSVSICLSLEAPAVVASTTGVMMAIQRIRWQFVGEEQSVRDIAQEDVCLLPALPIKTTILRDYLTAIERNFE